MMESTTSGHDGGHHMTESITTCHMTEGVSHDGEAIRDGASDMTERHMPAREPRRQSLLDGRTPPFMPQVTIDHPLTTIQPATLQPATIQPATLQPATIQPATTLLPVTLQPVTIRPVTIRLADPRADTPSGAHPASTHF